MTAHDPVLQWPEDAPPAHFVAARPLVRPLASLAAVTVIAAAGVFALLGPARPRNFAALPPSGLAGIASSSLLLAALGLVACLLITRTRQRGIAPRDGLAAKVSLRQGASWPGILLTLAFTLAAAGAVLADWPTALSVPPPGAVSAPPPVPLAAAHALAATAGFTMASALLLLAAPWLLAERYFSTVTPEALPEVEDLRRLLFLPVVFLGAEAALQVAAALGFGPLPWARVGLAALVLAVCAELSLRVLATAFLPPPDSVHARAAIASFLAGVLRGRALSPASVAQTVRSQFGMDFSRSWALHFMRSAFLPVVLLMLAFCWFLTGVTRVDLNQRGSYERFGVPVAMLQPGLHLVLPWPFGMVRMTEQGVIHSVAISYGDGGAAARDAVPRDVAAGGLDHATAEGDPPASANRLWDSDLPSDVAYIIASDDLDHQSFQTVTASVRVLFRVGLNDAAARDALYREADPAALVHALAGRMLVQLFASQTLPNLLSGSQAVIAAEMQRHLQRALDSLDSGIQIVSVVVEAIHPPAGAASAYRNVQAAEIEAKTEIASERGRAKTTASIASLNAHNAIDDATAAAAETVSNAQVDLTDITADDGPYRAASRPFLMERYFSDLQSALHDVPLEIVDHRLNGASLPTIDLRPPGAVADGPEAFPDQRGKEP
jgi:regulator of protease activity HflC (stomatin/prohibitin superfamily)